MTCKSLEYNHRSLVGTSLTNIGSLVVYNVYSGKKKVSRPTISKRSCSEATDLLGRD